MSCRKCNGRTFLDRVFSDNKNFETYCIICGHREFISKDTEFGKWLTKQETALAHARSIAS